MPFDTPTFVVRMQSEPGVDAKDEFVVNMVAHAERSPSPRAVLPDLPKHWFV